VRVVRATQVGVPERTSPLRDVVWSQCAALGSDPGYDLRTGSQDLPDLPRSGFPNFPVGGPISDASRSVKALRNMRVLGPLAEGGQYASLFEASKAWSAGAGGPPRGFVTDITTTAPEPRADEIILLLRRCGFELYRHDGVDDVTSAVEGFRRSHASLALICARGFSDPAFVRPFVLSLEDADYILVTGERPDARAAREGDPGSRGYYLDPGEGEETLLATMRFIMRGLGIFH
jgi:hypothetical protein